MNKMKTKGCPNISKDCDGEKLKSGVNIKIGEFQFTDSFFPKLGSVWFQRHCGTQFKLGLKRFF